MDPGKGVILVVVLAGQDPAQSGLELVNLHQTKESLRAQTFVSWRLVVVHSLEHRERELSEASEEFVVLMEAGDWLEPEALARCVDIVQDQPSIDVVYSDHDMWRCSGDEPATGEPVYKPAW